MALKSDVSSGQGLLSSCKNMELQPPATLYKYLDLIGGFKTLENCNLKFTPPNAFNDPFEFMPGEYKIDDRAYALKKVKESLKQYAQKNPAAANKINQGLLEIDNDPVYADKMLKELHYQINKGDKKSLVYEISKKILCSCFSEQKDNLLMWAHYADMHRGIVLEFSTKFLSDLHKVKYTTERVTIPWREKEETPHYKQAIELLKTTKSTDWTYEKEWRCIRQYDEAEQKGDLYFFPFPHQAVVSVILGAQFPETEKARIKKLFLKFPDCKLYQAKLHQSQFKLEFENIP